MNRKRFGRAFLLLVAAVLVAVAVVGCSDSKSTETTVASGTTIAGQTTDSTAPPVTTPGKQSTLRIGWSESPQAGMNPFLARSEGDYVYLGLMYEPLAMPMMDGTLRPWLAKSWTYNATDNSWTFVLDERAKWSDGQPLTADDVKFTFDTAYKLDLAIGATTKAFVKSVDVVDAQTVSFKLAEPLAAFASLAGGTLIMPKHIWESVPDVAKAENATPVGSGPFVFKEFKARAYLDVTKNPDYWQGPVNVDEVIVQVFSNMEAEVMALKQGDLDVMPDLSGSEALIPALISDSNVKVLIDKWPHILYLAPNYRVPALANLEVRKAMDLAIDRSAILNTALAGYGEMPLMGYVPPVVTKWADTSLTWKGLDLSGEQRVKDANAILDAAGFKAGADGVRVGADGKKLEFTVRCITYPSYVRASELIKEDLSKIGIKISVEVSDPETLYGGLIYSGEGGDKWELLVHGSTMTPDPDNFAREYAPDTPQPWDNATAFGISSPALQTLLKQSRREMDETKRIEQVKQAEKMFADELVVISLAHRFHPAAYRTDRFTGWNPEPVAYGGMVHPLASILNLISIKAN
jgi:peptide/nickel transport system substrate-binding protein